MYRKKHNLSINRVQYSLWLQASTGCLGMFPPWIRGDSCLRNSQTLESSLFQVPVSPCLFLCPCFYVSLSQSPTLCLSMSLCPSASLCQFLSPSLSLSLWPRLEDLGQYTNMVERAGSAPWVKWAGSDHRDLCCLVV